jgi:hypothetical protein
LARGATSFGFDLIDYEEDEDEDEIFDFDSDIISVFSDVKVAEIEFKESIHLFISDPQELAASGVRAEAYQAAEEIRMVKALSSMAGGSAADRNEIEIPDLFMGPPLGIMLKSNFETMRNSLSVEKEKEKIVDIDLSVV